MRALKQPRDATPSLFASTLSGVAPTLRCEVPQGARRLHLLKDEPAGAKTRAGGAARLARDFTASDKMLIRRLHGYMPAAQLLGVLNERLAGDLGDATAPYTLDQIRTEIVSVVGAVPAGERDWSSLRRLLARARDEGVLDRIDESLIDDFAVVFSLNPKQVLSLKDILLSEGED